MSTRNLLILSHHHAPLVTACAQGYGFTSETQITEDWRAHFNEHARKQVSLLANPTALLDRLIRSTLVINGPNLNLLGTREPHIYGEDTLADINRRCAALSEASPCALDFRQSNHEGEIVTWIQEATAIDTIVINAGAYTHTSIAIHDALKSYPGLVAEIHISNPHQRESFRHQSFITSTADAAAVGLGTAGYDLIIELICTEANAI